MADSTVETDALLFPSRAADAGGAVSTQRRYRRFSLWIALTDALALEAAIILARFIRFGFQPVTSRLTILLLVAPLVWGPIFAASGLYSLTRFSPAEEFRRVIQASAIALVVKLLIDASQGQPVLDALGGGWLAVTWILALLGTLTARQIWHKHLGRLRAKGELSYRTAIVGANREARHIAQSLQTRFLGYLPVGLIRIGAAGAEEEEGDFPVLGSAEELSDVIRGYGIECVFVASTAVYPEIMKRLTKLLRRHHVEVRISANLAHVLSSRLTIQPVGDLLVLSLRPVQLTGLQAVAKRTFDLIVGGFLFLLSTPLWLVSAVAIKVSSLGPVFYPQERVGQNGRVFTMYKFRTMGRGADQLLPELLKKNEFTGGVLFKLRNDPRVTRVGRWLRRYSLDELPQLVNVLKGDMSLVGPRPALPNEVATYEDWHRDRLEVRPGITGLWQVGGRSELSFDDYVRLDLFYIENWSVTYDLFILGKTIPAVLLPKGAF